MNIELNSFKRQIQQLEYDHAANSKLELLGDTESDDDDELFTFNSHEIYVTDPEDEVSRDYHDNYDIDERSEAEVVQDYQDGFGVDDLFNPRKGVDRDSSYDQVNNNLSNMNVGIVLSGFLSVL